MAAGVRSRLGRGSTGAGGCRIGAQQHPSTSIHVQRACVCSLSVADKPFSACLERLVYNTNFD